MKYPRTPHLPWSPGKTRDDRTISDLSILESSDIVITEKLDGSNLCLTKDSIFARSHNGPPTHPSFDAAKSLHANVRHLIPEGISLFGEWCWAVHSIKYSVLPSSFFLFGVRLANLDWLSWHSVEMWAAKLDVFTAPVLANRVSGGLEATTNMYGKLPSVYGPIREGVVVRVSAGISRKNWDRSVAKWVRSDHVQTDVHWRNQSIERHGISK